MDKLQPGQTWIKTSTGQKVDIIEAINLLVRIQTHGEAESWWVMRSQFEGSSAVYRILAEDVKMLPSPAWRELAA